jgi:hypothetical protein
MPLETVIVVAGVLAMFGIFAAALGWGMAQHTAVPDATKR